MVAGQKILRIWMRGPVGYVFIGLALDGVTGEAVVHVGLGFFPHLDTCGL